MLPSHHYIPYPTRDKPEHPHCLQALPLVLAVGFQDILSHGSSPRENYVPRDKQANSASVVHRGQRKLLMSEIGALVRLDPAKQYTAV